ncbi:FeoA family protein [Thiorhodovibrio frisius]|uniref:Fe2+ transport system protein A n=1 Tax=Thiorhodovibrio frisius TaxID=631362 RepID=H8Z3P4_9GAMM|nr:FeoA family protein [Thiorhodovibrio frisius]EIC20033.1 Fe2+ transport system protein A [Thiorhodovibrio frisius]WPL20761.1 FeoA domain protein [Thiorhodovibrio frisius]
MDKTATFGPIPASPPAPATLAELPLGARARVIGISGGRDLSRRLLALGVRLGSELRVEHHRGRARVVSIGPTRVALGGGIAEKLRVEPLDAVLPQDAAPLSDPSA